MRYLKRLLAAIYLYLGIFAAVCLVLWIITRDEPAALIAGVFGAAGIESVVGAIIKQSEIRAEKALQKRSAEDESAAEAQRDERIM